MDYLEKVLSQAGLPPKIAFDMTRNDWVSGLGEVFDSVVLGTKVFIKPLSRRKTEQNRKLTKTTESMPKRKSKIDFLMNLLGPIRFSLQLSVLSPKN